MQRGRCRARGALGPRLGEGAEAALTPAQLALRVLAEPVEPGAAEEGCQVTERLWSEYEAFTSRDLSEYEIAYLFADGIAERLHGGQRREAVLCAWGITLEGQKVLLHPSPGTKEDTESCRAFFQDLKRRGLGDPRFVATDGAPGLIRAVEECFPRSVRGRCLAHRMRNLQSKIPDAE